MDPFSEEDPSRHSSEPWRQEGRYIRDASGAIVVRGKSFADARRIVAAVNATRGIPTEALESWFVQDVSDPDGRPELEVDLSEEAGSSPFAVSPPRESGELSFDELGDADPGPEDPARTASSSTAFDFERRVFERRTGHRRAPRERRKSQRRTPTG